MAFDPSSLAKPGFLIRSWNGLPRGGKSTLQFGQSCDDSQESYGAILYLRLQAVRLNERTFCLITRCKDSASAQLSPTQPFDWRGSVFILYSQVGRERYV